MPFSPEVEADSAAFEDVGALRFFGRCSSSDNASEISDSSSDSTTAPYDPSPGASSTSESLSVSGSKYLLLVAAFRAPRTGSCFLLRSPLFGTVASFSSSVFFDLRAILRVVCLASQEWFLPSGDEGPMNPDAL